MLAALCTLPGSAAAATSTSAAVPGELIVGYDEGVGATVRSALRDDLGLHRIRGLRVGGHTELVKVRGRSLDGLKALAERIAGLPGVAYAEPNWRVTADAVPDDEYFARRQWALRNTGTFNLIDNFGNDFVVKSKPGGDISAVDAWDITTGSPNVVVAVVDTGVDASHEDLRGQLDNARSIDLVGGAPDPSGHGTHVAGIIAGAANGRGTVGIAWNTRVLSVRAVPSGGSGDSATAAEGVRYAAEMGAQVVNMSFGSVGPSLVMTKAIVDHPNTLFVASAGNKGRDNDRNAYFPCDIPVPNLICVASSDADDELASTSSYGPGTVQLAAPGDRIMNAGPGGDEVYVYKSGTSMATATVSGIAALMAAGAPWAGPAEQKICLMASATRLPALEGLVSTGGRANALGALRACGDRVAPDRAPVQISPPNGARVRAKGLAFEFVAGHDALSGIASNTVIMDGEPVADGQAVAAGKALAKVRRATRVSDGRHRWFVRSTDKFGNSRDSGTRAIVVDGTGPKLTVRVKARSAAKGLRVGLRLNEEARITTALRIGRRTLTSKHATRFRKGRRDLTVRLPGALRAKAAGKRASLKLTLTDKVGNVTSKQLVVKLR